MDAFAAAWFLFLCDLIVERLAVENPQRGHDEISSKQVLSQLSPLPPPPSSSSLPCIGNAQESRSNCDTAPYPMFERALF